MPLTLEDIAKLSGFSRSTVSRAINGDPNVSEATRKQVMGIVDQLNFQPNLAARGLAAGHTKVLGLVIPMGVNAIFTDPFFPLLIQSVSSECNIHDYSVMLWLAEPEYERRMISRMMYNGLVDGVIVSSMMMDDPIVEALIKGKLPFILIGRHPTNSDISYVDVDNWTGAKTAVNHLAELGRTRIGTITGPQNMIVGRDRYQGYLDALKEHGLKTNINLITEGNFTVTSGAEAMKKMLKHQPDAVFAASDAMAGGAIRALQEEGYKVPDDVAIIGFDDIPSACMTVPPLTTIKQPIRQVGSVAAKTLIKMIEQPQKESYHIILPTKLVVRSSCSRKKEEVNTSKKKPS